MNGELLGSRAIRVSWENRRTQEGATPLAPAPINFQGGPLSCEAVVQQTPAYNTTVDVDSLASHCTQAYPPGPTITDCSAVCDAASSGQPDLVDENDIVIA